MESNNEREDVGGERPFNIEPTPRTYIADAWSDPSRRREVLDYLAQVYDWYLERMISYRLCDFGITGDTEHKACIEAVKTRFFLPENKALAGDAKKFWLSKWERARGPLRNFFRTCVRNYITDWLRRGGARRAIKEFSEQEHYRNLSHSDLGTETPYEELERLEFEARFDKKLFVERAMNTYRDECGKDSLKWHIYEASFRGGWPPLDKTALLDKFPASTSDSIDQALYKGRKRVSEALWWLIRELEIDDASADRSMLELVGRLPKCRSKRLRPPGIGGNRRSKNDAAG